MKDTKHGLNSIDVPLYRNVEPGFIPFYEVSADLVEMKNIKPEENR
ncbi:MAG: hypothetical protein WCY82_11365 [Desulfotomaculaceae bacterium]